MKTTPERIAEHPFFLGMPHDHVELAADGAKVVAFHPGDIVIHEGEPANRFYLIESGGVALEAHEPADGTFPIQTLTKGEALGWSWMLSPFVWHFQARALEPTVMIALDAANLLTIAEKNHVFGYELMKRISHLLMSRLRVTREKLIQCETSHFKEHSCDCTETHLEILPQHR